jgi:hypothetical protein
MNKSGDTAAIIPLLPNGWELISANAGLNAPLRSTRWQPKVSELMSALGKSRHLQCKKACPLGSRKRTCAVQLMMSAKGHKRTLMSFAFSKTFGLRQELMSHSKHC